MQFITMQCKMVLCSSFQCNARWFCAVTALLFITMQNDGLVGQVLHDRVSRGVTQPLFNHLQFGYSSSYKSGLIVIIYYQKWPFIIHLYKRGGIPAFIHALTIRIFIPSVKFMINCHPLLSEMIIYYLSLSRERSPCFYSSTYNSDIRRQICILKWMECVRLN